MRVFILGNDHTNTVGVVQSFGEVGIRPICCLWGHITGIVKASKYTDSIISAKSSEECVKKIVDTYSNTGGIIIPCSDEATYQLYKNKSLLQNNNYCFEQLGNSLYNIEWLLQKSNQVSLAKECGFRVPFSIEIEKLEDIPQTMVFPCLIKPLISMEGGKAWTKICYNSEELHDICAKALGNISKILLQQYIEKDFDYVVLGCGLKDGSCVLPGLIKKHKLFPMRTGLETVVTIDGLDNHEIESSIRTYISKLGLVGLFSIEFVHTPQGEFYFVEINPRNDGVNQVVLKSGVNLPYIHYCDMKGTPFSVTNIKKTQMIWEMHHFMSFVRRDTSLKEWLSDILHSDCWMVFSKKDKKPFFMQFYRLFGEKIGLLKVCNYK